MKTAWLGLDNIAYLVTQYQKNSYSYSVVLSVNKKQGSHLRFCDYFMCNSLQLL